MLNSGIQVHHTSMKKFLFMDGDKLSEYSTILELGCGTGYST